MKGTRDHCNETPRFSLNSGSNIPLELVFLACFEKAASAGVSAMSRIVHEKEESMLCDYSTMHTRIHEIT